MTAYCPNCAQLKACAIVADVPLSRDASDSLLSSWAKVVRVRFTGCEHTTTVVVQL